MKEPTTIPPGHHAQRGGQRRPPYHGAVDALALIEGTEPEAVARAALAVMPLDNRDAHAAIQDWLQFRRTRGSLGDIYRAVWAERNRLKARERGKRGRP